METMIVTFFNLGVLAMIAGLGIYIIMLVIKGLKVYLNKNS